MPPKRSQRRKRPAQAGLAAEPPARRSRRTSTLHATLASESTQLTTSEPSNSPPDSTPCVTARSAPFSADQIQALVSTVAAEVTKQLTAQFPALTDVQGTETPTPVASRLPGRPVHSFRNRHPLLNLLQFRPCSTELLQRLMHK